MTMFDIPEGTVCVHCGEHPATEVQADSIMEFTHGMYRYSCRCCVVKQSIDYAEKQAARLPHLRVQLGRSCEEMDLGVAELRHVRVGHRTWYSDRCCTDREVGGREE